MGTLGGLLHDWGYPLLVLLGFIEFIGLPVASVPVLVLAGAAVATGHLSLPLVVLSAAAGGLTADLTWYGLTRWRGAGLVDTVCNLTSNPGACIVRVTGRVRRVGPLYVLPSKFLPGTGNLIAAASGLAGVGARAFVLADGAALLAWAGFYAAAGYLFSAEVIELVEWVGHFTNIAAAVAALLIVGATGWRVVRARMHADMHAAAGNKDSNYDPAKANVQVTGVSPDSGHSAIRLVSNDSVPSANEPVYRSSVDRIVQPVDSSNAGPPPPEAPSRIATAPSDVTVPVTKPLPAPQSSLWAWE